jgi:hypothetical protein
LNTSSIWGHLFPPATSEIALIRLGSVLLYVLIPQATWRCSAFHQPNLSSLLHSSAHGSDVRNFLGQKLKS